MFAVAGPGLLAVLVIGLLGLPDFGHLHTIYNALVQRFEPGERKATDLVTALNFDLRAFDTLGEEFILFASVAGVALLLRHLRGGDSPERPSAPDEHAFASSSDGLRLLSIILVPLLIGLGGYLITHGQLTPGGGFQGGVVLAAAPVGVLLAGRYLALKVHAPEWALESLDSAGAAAYVLIGVGGMIFTAAFLQNFLPAGTPGMLLSSGTIPLNSIAVGVEVTGAFLLTWSEFLDQTLTAEGP
jgi:multicomponent Na+:H+ antiporter subunit B